MPATLGSNHMDRWGAFGMAAQDRLKSRSGLLGLVGRVQLIYFRTMTNEAGYRLAATAGFCLSGRAEQNKNIG